MILLWYALILTLMFMKMNSAKQGLQSQTCQITFPSTWIPSWYNYYFLGNVILSWIQTQCFWHHIDFSQAMLITSSWLATFETQYSTSKFHCNQTEATFVSHKKSRFNQTRSKAGWLFPSSLLFQINNRLVMDYWQKIDVYSFNKFFVQTGRLIV